MTSVSVTTTKNTVTVNGETRVVTVKTQGPQGPSLPDGDKGDVTVSSNGTAISINNSAVTTAKIADDAVNSTKIADGAINAAAMLSDNLIQEAKIQDSAIATAKIADSAVTSAKIADEAIVDADINASAAIALSKLATGALPTAITVTSANISDLSIVNADINASAAIQGTKISPNFGSQNIVTTGLVETGVNSSQFGNNLLRFKSNGDGFIDHNTTGQDINFRTSNSSALDTTGMTIKANGNVDFANGIDITGNISVTGTVDGRDVATDGTKLDTLSASTIQNGTSFVSVSNNADITISRAGSTRFTATGAGVDVTGDLTISSATPVINLTDTDNDSDYQIKNGNGDFNIKDTTNGVNRLTIDSSGLVTITNNLTVTGNFTVNGTTTTIDTTTLTVEDKNIELGKVSTPTDTTADGGGITLKGATDKTFQWLDATDSWTSSEHIALPDNKKLQLGASQDLQIYHDGNHSKIVDSGPFATIIQSKQLNINNAANSESLARLIENGAVELYYDNSKKLHTDSFGVIVSGGLALDGDNLELRIGNSQDLKVYHDGTNSYIDSNTGLLNIRSIGSAANVQIIADTDYMARFVNDGAVELYYDNSKKLETVSNGNKAHGHYFTDDGNKIQLGTSQDLQIYHDGSNSYINNTFATGDLILDSAQNFYIKHSGEIQIQAVNDGAVNLYYDSSKKLETTSTGISVTGNITVSGTVDGRDLATDGTKLDGIESNATADQTASEIVALVADQTIAPSEIDMEDNEKIKIGTGDDLQIYHDGDNSYIIDIGTGSLILGGDRIRLRSSTGEDGIEMLQDGAVELYYDNSKKLETYTAGVEVIGNLRLQSGGAYFSDNVKAHFGNSSDLQIYHDGSNSYIQDSGTGALRIQTNQLDIINAANNEQLAKFVEDGAAELYYNGIKKFETTADGILTQGTILHRGAEGGTAQIRIEADEGDDNADKWRLISQTDGTFDLQNNASGSYETNISATGNGAVELYYDSSKKLETTSTGITVTGDASTGTIIQGAFSLRDTTSSSDRIKWIPSSSILKFNNNYKAAFGDSSDLQIYHDGSNSYIDNSTNGLFIRSDSLQLYKKSASERYIVCAADAAVKLFYDNSLKLETTTSGVSVTGEITATSHLDLPDDAAIKFGDSDDLQIYHDGSNSYIDENGTGELQLRTINGSNINLIGGSDFLAKFIKDGAVELYYDSSKKLETTSTGVNVTGGINSTVAGGNNTLTIETTTSGDPKVSLNAAGSGGHDIEYIRSSNTLNFKQGGGSVRMSIAADGTVNVANNLDVGAGIDVTGAITGTTNLTVGGASSIFAENNLRFKSSGDAFIDHNTTGQDIKFRVSNSSSLDTTPVTIQSDGQVNVGGMQFYQSNNAAIPIDNAQFKLGAGDDLKLYHDGSHSVIKNETGSLYAVSDTSIILQAATGGDVYLKGIKSGAVELYYGGAKKIETTSGGVSVTGNVDCDGIRMLDSAEIRLGTGDDIKISHDGTNSYIDNYTGVLNVRSLGSGANVQIIADSDYMARFVNDGAVELYYDHSKKFETTSYGAAITSSGSSHGLKVFHSNGNEVASLTHGGTGDEGALILRDSNTATVAIRGEVGQDIDITTGGNFDLEHDSAKLRLGASADLQIYHDGSNSRIHNTTGELIFRTGSNYVFYNSDGTEKHAKFISDGAVELYYDNSKKLHTDNFGIIVSGGLALDGDDLELRIGNNQDLKLYHDGSDSYIKNTGTGNLYIDGDTDDLVLQAGDDVRIQTQGNENAINCVGNGAVELYHNGNKKLETTTSGVTVSGTVTETSDIALKSNIQPITNTLEKVQQITGYKYNLINSISPSMGVIAQDVEKVFPELVHGSEGKKTLQYSGLIGVLVEAVKDLSAKVAALEGG